MKVIITEEDHAFAQEFVGRPRVDQVAGTVPEFHSKATGFFRFDRVETARLNLGAS